MNLGISPTLESTTRNGVIISINLPTNSSYCLLINY
uniref:Uncharacterized protein n=1 Tax=Manihot esculenta TaxID=3983 RepID=A0A2C9U861_MANES